MFQINGKPLAIDTAFTHNDVQYPPNWLRLSTTADRKRLGITEVADAPRADDRFYWNGDITSPKDLGQLKSMLLAQIKQTANSMLAPSDWQVTRATEGIKSMPAMTVAKRSAVRSAATANEGAINACTTVDELAALQLSWPDLDNVPAVVPPVVSRFQARAALLAAGLLDQVEALMANESTPAIAKLAWADAQEFKRNSPTVNALAASLQLTEAQLDELFTAAATIDA